MDLKTALLNRLDEARAGLESVLPRVERSGEIYPGWTIKQMLDHLAGWDDAVTASLRAHLNGQTPATPAERGIDDYNAQTVSTRESLDYEHTYREFRVSREILKQALLSLPDEKLAEPLILPWGRTGTVSEVIEIFAHHEQEHTADILRWLEDPSKPIVDSPA